MVLDATDAQTFDPTDGGDGINYHPGIRESIFEFDYADGISKYEIGTAHVIPDFIESAPKSGLKC